MADHFANTALTVRDRKGNTRQYKAGQIVRRKGTTDAWMDFIIAGFSDVDKYGTLGVKLFRPYAYVSCIGTTSPSLLQGREEMGVTADQLVRDFDLYTNSPMVAGGPRPEYDSENVVCDVKVEIA